ATEIGASGGRSGSGYALTVTSSAIRAPIVTTYSGRAAGSPHPGPRRDDADGRRVLAREAFDLVAEVGDVRAVFLHVRSLLLLDPFAGDLCRPFEDGHVFAEAVVRQVHRDLGVRADVPNLGGRWLAVHEERRAVPQEPHRGALGLTVGANGRQPHDGILLESRFHVCPFRMALVDQRHLFLTTLVVGPGPPLGGALLARSAP